MKGREEALRLLAEAELLHGAEEVRAAVTRMAAAIQAKLEREFPVVLSVMGGAAIFTGQLLPQLRFPLEFGAIEVTRYNNDIQGREITWRLAPRDNVRGRTVLVVDDILDEGITLAAIRNKLMQMGAKQFYSAVFADKDLGREWKLTGPAGSYLARDAGVGERPLSGWNGLAVSGPPVCR